MHLREYQSRMIADIQQAWAAGAPRVLGVLPTGAGKTEVAIALALEEMQQERRVLVVTERKTLAHQWAQRFVRHGVADIGLIQADNTRRTYARGVVGTIQSLASRGVPERLGLIVIDEAHIEHKAHRKLLADNPQARVLGLTATPLRDGLGQTYSCMVVGATIRDLTAAGFLVPARTLAPGADGLAAALEQVSVSAGDYAGGELSALMRNRAIVSDVVSTWQARAEDRQTIAFCVDKEHARRLAQEFAEAGIGSAYVLDETDDEERADLFARFDNREIRVLCSVGVLALGFDAPVAACAVLARPTLSLALHIQQGGRVLRPFPGKADALILDHACNTLRHGRIEDFEPPRELSMLDAHADRKKRREPIQAWVCPNCEAVNPVCADMCNECGQPRYRRTHAVVLDGELREVPEIPGEPLPGATPQQIQDFYLMARWRAEHLGFNDGWAFYATMRRFGIQGELAKRLVPWRLRNEAAIAPDVDAARWFRAERIRYLKGRSADPAQWRGSARQG
ncbi:DEAD/DEAH box helicase [Paraburkholderia silvatlantica]|uniref:DEAD/DEAH box helicase n=1 Tax=Paraburkholderia silvatlantica TaxID=321895 RepID=UPI001061A1EB|nr:DEAD/DEAH box helicase [Paraburkholderia silvatlantica]TDR04344.1 superfamily II DNA or RNA helicase [Paraburkholderia silvatlantica]